VPLTAKQRFVYIQIKQEQYPQFDAKVREALEIFPECRIVTTEAHSYMWGTELFVLIETI
jgi:hypothetical protein